MKLFAIHLPPSNHCVPSLRPSYARPLTACSQRHSLILGTFFMVTNQDSHSYIVAINLVHQKPVATCSKAFTVFGMGLRVRISLEALIYAYTCVCVAPCKYRPYDGPINSPRMAYQKPKTITVSEIHSKTEPNPEGHTQQYKYYKLFFFQWFDSP
jgi:hypothetical protein